MFRGSLDGFYHRYIDVRRKEKYYGVIDRLTKYAHFCSLSDPFSATIVAAIFMDIVEKLHVNPKISVSDRDPILTWKFWIELFSFLGT